MNAPALETLGLQKSFGALTVANAVDFRLDRGRHSLIIKGIRVATHGADRRDQLQLIEYFLSAHISRVENQLDARERGMNVRANEAVRV